MKIAVIFSRHAEALFNKNSKRTYGGGEIQMYNIAKEMGKHVETYSLLQDYDEVNFDEKENFKIVKTFKDNDNLLVKFSKMTKAISKVNPDVVIQRGVTPYSYFLAKYCKLKKIKFVLMFGHDLEADGIYQSSLKKCRSFKPLIRNSSKVIVQNSFQEKKVNRLNKKVYILKKGLDLKNLKTKNTEKKYDGIWIGRSESWKRPDVFLDLVQANPSLKFLMVLNKEHHSRDYFFLVKKRADSLKNLKFIENVSNKEIHNLMSQSKILLFTSQKEGDWPMVVLEASAMGLPILSYSLNYDYLIDEYGGGVFCNEDSKLFKSGFNELISNDEKYLEMSEGAKKYVKDHHELSNMVKKYLKILEDD